MEIRPVTGVFGAEVLGVRLARLTESELADVREAMCRYELVVFRSQHLSPAEQSEFSRRLGESAETPFVRTMDDHPDVIRVVKEADEGATFNFGGAWHSDFSFLEHPPSFTILAAVDVPPYGGDTMFASMSAAWRSLDHATQERRPALGAPGVRHQALQRGPGAWPLSRMEG